MDERKNVKVIDEHSIDREANIMCGIDVDGTDYVVYSIKRDDENDNLFVSKLIKNNDGTSSMVNIEDSMEKTKLADTVKELVTYAINNDADKSTGVVKLNSGKEVKVTGVMFNKEQNINVGKTYITTVKRAVTKVGGNFYNVEVPKPEPVVESVFDVPSVTNDVFPDMSTLTEPEAPAAVPGVEPILPEAPVSEPVVVPPVVPETPAVVDTVSQTVLPEVSTVLKEPVTVPAVEPILPETPVVSAPVENVDNVLPQPLENNAAAQIVVPNVEEVVVPPISVVEPTPTSVVTAEAPAATPVENQLVFDASKETNLNTALGEVSKDNVLPVQDVTSIREFGQDEPVMAAPSSVPSSVDQPVVAASTEKAGFANNKFFMVVAITFFLAACVFLGYEVFQYFKIVG